MQSGHDEKMDTEVREILDYYRRLPDRGSQEVIVSMLRELQDVCGWIGPSILEAAAQAAGVKVSLIQVIMKRYPSLKNPLMSMRLLSAQAETVQAGTILRSCRR